MQKCFEEILKPRGRYEVEFAGEVGRPVHGAESRVRWLGLYNSYAFSFWNLKLVPIHHYVKLSSERKPAAAAREYV